MLTEALDILMITENKLNDFFPDAQFQYEGVVTFFRLDCYIHGRDISLNVCSNVNAVLLKGYEFPNYIEAFFTERAVRLCKRQKIFLFTSNKLTKY